MKKTTIELTKSDAMILVKGFESLHSLILGLDSGGLGRIYTADVEDVLNGLEECLTNEDDEEPDEKENENEDEVYDVWRSKSEMIDLPLLTCYDTYGDKFRGHFLGTVQYGLNFLDENDYEIMTEVKSVLRTGKSLTITDKFNDTVFYDVKKFPPEWIDLLPVNTTVGIDD